MFSINHLRIGLLMLILLMVGPLRSQYVFGEKEVAFFVLGGATHAQYDEYNKVLQNNGFAELNTWSPSAGFEGVIPIHRVFVKLGLSGSSQEHLAGDDEYTRWKITNAGVSVGYDLLKGEKISIVPFVGLGGQFEKLRLNGSGQMENPDGTTYDYEVDGEYSVRGVAGQVGVGSYYQIQLKPERLALLLGVQAQYYRSVESTVKKSYTGGSAWLASLDYSEVSVDGVLSISALVGLSF